MSENNIEIEVEIDQPTGTKDHKKLINRGIADQHPIGAITNLQETLDEKEFDEVMEKVKNERV